MGTSGRRAGPAQDKVIRGVFRADRHSHGPRIEPGVPACPKWMPRRARKHWGEIGPKLAALGLLADVDSAVFGLYCDSYGRFQEVTERLRRLDDCIDRTPQDYMVQSAFFTVRNKLWDQVLRSAQEFGLSPGARSRVTHAQQLDLFGDDDGNSEDQSPGRFFNR